MNQKLYEWIANLLPGTILYHQGGRVYTKCARQMRYNIGRDFLFCVTDGYVYPVSELINPDVSLELFLTEFQLQPPEPVVIEEAKPAQRQLEF